MRQKLATYSLDPGHPDGGPKARGFEQMLGIRLESIDYLAIEIHSGIQAAPVIAIRQNQPHGINCVVEFPLRGVGDYQARVVNLRTIWLVARDVPPRLVSALLKP